MCFLAWAQAMSVQEFAATLALGEHTVRGYRNSFLEGFDTMPGVGPGAYSPRELVTPVVLLPTPWLGDKGVHLRLVSPLWLSLRPVSGTSIAVEFCP